jgi:hypothetical protein
MLDGRFFYRPMLILELMIDFLVILSVRTVQSVIFIYREDSYSLLVHFLFIFSLCDNLFVGIVGKNLRYSKNALVSISCRVQP